MPDGLVAKELQADLTSGGFKLVGSAQVWKDDALLQQGSLPLDDRAAEFFSMLRYPTETARQEALRRFAAEMGPVVEIDTTAASPQQTARRAWDAVAPFL